MRALALAALLGLALPAQADFAFFFNDEDAAVIAGNLNRNDLTTQERQTAQKMWNGGVKDWGTAPVALSPCDDPNLPFSSKRIVVSGQNLTKQQLVDLLLSIASHIGLPQPGGYLIALANDIDQCAVEPFP